MNFSLCHSRNDFFSWPEDSTLLWPLLLICLLLGTSRTTSYVVKRGNINVRPLKLRQIDFLLWHFHDTYNIYCWNGAFSKNSGNKYGLVVVIFYMLLFNLASLYFCLSRLNPILAHFYWVLYTYSTDNTIYFINTKIKIKNVI